MRVATLPRQPRRLAVLRAGAVSVGDRVYALGEALPTRAAIHVDSTAEVESEDAVRVMLAARSRFSVRTGRDGEPIFHVTRGALFARSEPGKRPYAVETKDALATPRGTSFFVSVSPSGRKTRYATFDGAVRLEDAENQLDLPVRRGFQTHVARGRISRLPVAIEHPAKALRWIPRAQRPGIPALPRILRSFTFDADNRAGFSAGTLHPVGAMRSRGCLRGVAVEKNAAVVQLEDNNVFPLATDLWIEAMCKVSRPTNISFRVWGTHKGTSVKVCMPLAADRWVPLAVPLGKLKSSPGGKSIADLNGPCQRLEIRAGDSKGTTPVELFVDNVRFYRLAD